MMLRYSTLMTALLVCCQTAWCAAGDIKLRFPEDRTCGTVSIGPQPPGSWGQTKTGFFVPLRKVGMARGVLTVPDDAFVDLNVSQAAAADLSFLNALPAGSIHSLQVTGANLGDTELAAIARLALLRRLGLANCRSAPNTDVDRAPPATALQYLRSSMSDEQGRRIVAAWAAKCPKLQYLYDDGGSFDAKALRKFKGHPAIDFLRVDFDANAAEVIQALSDIPHLRSLNVYVQTDDYLQSLALLQGVERFNWSGGRIDAATLKTFGKLPHLRYLLFQGDTKIEADFAQGLQYLTAVEEFGLQTLKNDCPADELQAALCSMKRLTEWPEIRLATKQTLETMAARGDLKRININGLATDATVEDVARLCRTKTLETVILRGIPFTAALGDALSTCPYLSEVHLYLENFDGDNLAHPEGFVSLRSLDLVVDQNAINLSPLARLPRLDDLTLSVNSFQRVDYRFVAESHSLRRFYTGSSVVDDDSIQEIARTGSVVSLHLGDNCILSDAGLERLSQCRQLTDLSVGGNLSVAGIRKLDRIPGLSSLSVSSLLSESERKSLPAHFANLTSARFGTFESRLVEPVVGPDGFWRDNDPEWRKEMDALEGKNLRDLLGPAQWDSLGKELQGKVVLVDFWGTWCVPCMALMPDLQRFHETYGKERFAILGIHAKQGVNTMDGYLQKNPKPWANLPDTNGKLEESFAVPHYPGVYLFDRQGKLRLAIPFRPAMESAIRKLLQEN